MKAGKKEEEDERERKRREGEPVACTFSPYFSPSFHPIQSRGSYSLLLFSLGFFFRQRRRWQL
jgi:hypothetical protein